MARELYDLNHAGSLNTTGHGGHSPAIFRCPSSPPTLVIWHAHSDYGINEVTQPEVNWDPNNNVNTPQFVERVRSIDSIRKPSETYWVGEAVGVRTADMTLRTTLGIRPSFRFLPRQPSSSEMVAGNYLHLRHRNGMNMLFYDGHVARLERQRILTEHSHPQHWQWFRQHEDSPWTP